MYNIGTTLLSASIVWGTMIVMITFVTVVAVVSIVMVFIICSQCYLVSVELV